MWPSKRECSEKLLTEVDLKLKKAVEIAQGMETAERNTKSLKPRLPVVQTVTASGGDSKVPCFRCGRPYHSPSNCRFVQATCHNCGKKGHIAPVCSSPRWSGNRQQGSFWGRGGRSFKGTNWLETEVEPSGNESEDANLRIYHVGSKARPITVELEVNGRHLAMEVDTGHIHHLTE